jgi:hypothetical protein
MPLKFKKGDAVRVEPKYASRLPIDIRGRWGEVLAYGPAMKAYFVKFVSPIGNHNTFMMWFSANELSGDDFPCEKPTIDCEFQFGDFVHVIKSDDYYHSGVLDRVGEVRGYIAHHESYLVWYQMRPFDDRILWFSAKELRKED